MKAFLSIKGNLFLLFILIQPIVIRAQIAPPDIALSLARIILSDSVVHTIGVTDFQNSQITGIDLSTTFNYYPNSPFDFIDSLGYDEIANLLLNSEKQEIFQQAQITTPIKNKIYSIATGINYAQHKDETKLSVKPFLFPKIINASGFNDTVHIDSEVLLDYEVELGIVFSKDIHLLNDLYNQHIGCIVLLDYSDRATMLKVFDNKNPKTAKGFTDSKSKTGYFPIGPLLVVPKNWQTFYPRLKLQLWRNNKLMQNDTSGNMIWGLETIVKEALKLGNDSLWVFQSKKISLLPKGFIEAETIVLTGTPGGVIFKPPSSALITKSVLKHIFGFGYLKRSIHKAVVTTYIKKSKRKKEFLQNCEHITAEITHLGKIYSSIKIKKND